jgi:transposase
VFADGGYAGNKLKTPLTEIGDWTIEVIRRYDRVKGFVVLPRRWVVERTFAWLFMASVQMLARRTAK